MPVKCSVEDQNAIIQCEDDARNVWNVDDITYYTSSRKFCCYFWNVLSCALEIADQCDPEYANELSIVTEQTIESLCDYSQGTSSCIFSAPSWWPVIPILVICLIICAAILVIAYPKTRIARSRTISTCDYEVAESST
ncbi:hypothetical protein BLOT_005411 [Blomia tropicalis]|nr:hypothetical protein BLOT_005411 [Blomia tropicalis]